MPFGGVMVLLVGDLAQLPPINAPFVFKSVSWELFKKKLEKFFYVRFQFFFFIWDFDISSTCKLSKIIFSIDKKKN